VRNPFAAAARAVYAIAVLAAGYWLLLVGGPVPLPASGPAAAGAGAAAAATQGRDLEATRRFLETLNPREVSTVAD